MQPPQQLYRRALAVMPGGVNSPVRAMGSIGRDPIFIASAVRLRADRRRRQHLHRLDLLLGAADLRPRQPRDRRCGHRGGSEGTSYGAATEGEVELAEAVCERFASVEMLRMVNSGTEATLSAVRLARAVTGRERLIKFAGAYHGHVDGLLADAGSGLATQGIPASPGVPAAQAAATTVVPWNDLRGGRHRDRGGRAPGARSCSSRSPRTWASSRPRGLHRASAQLADSSGALLVADEVISGFRVARGGAQELLGFDADLTIMGKVIGGGLPAAAYGGSRELLERVAPVGDVYQAGTLSGNPLAVAAGLTTLRLLDAAAYERIGELTDGSPPGCAPRSPPPAPPTGPASPLSRASQPCSWRPSPPRLRRRPRLRHRRLRQALPRAARARDLRAAGPVRGLVRLARARRSRDRPQLRRARRGPADRARLSP